MNDVFKVVLSMSLSASMLTVILLIFKPLYKNRIGKKWQYYIWLIAVLRLLLPFAPKGSPVGMLFGENTPAAVTDYSEPAVTETESSRAYVPDHGKELAKITETDAAAPEKDYCTAILDNLWIVWLAGAVITLSRKIMAYMICTRRIRQNCVNTGGKELSDVLDEHKTLIRVNRNVEILINPAAPSPMLIGFFKPAIILPAKELSKEEFRYIALHELTHLKRMDISYKWLVQTALCAHWFNPLIYVMEREIERTCELSCDETVLSALDISEYRAYGETLLTFAKPVEKHAAVITLSESGKLLKERLCAVMSHKKKPKKAAVISFVLAAVLMSGTAAAGAYTIPVSAKNTESNENTQSNGEDYDYPENELKASIFTQNGFYQAPYIFEMSWNLSPNAAKEYKSKKITLETGEALTVYFTKSCRKSMSSGAVTENLSKLLTKLCEENKNSKFELIRPLVISVSDTKGKSVRELAKEYYDADSDLPKFMSVFPFLNEKQKTVYLDKMYSDGETAFFAASLNVMENPSETAAKYAEKAYEDGDYAVFSISVKRLNDNQIKEWITRVKEDGQAGFLNILQSETDIIGIEPQKENPEYAANGITYKDGKFFYQSKRIRLLMDLRYDGSFERCFCDDEGAVDIKIQRDKNGAVKSVSYIPDSEAEELLSDMESDDFDDFDDFFEDVTRTDLEELPKEASKLLKSCSDKNWYILETENGRYVYYGGLSTDYAFISSRGDSSLEINITPIGKNKSGYVLLEVPYDMEISVKYNGKPVKPFLLILF